MTWKLLYIFQYKDNVWGIKKDAFWSMHYSDTKDIPALDIGYSYEYFTSIIFFHLSLGFMLLWIFSDIFMNILFLSSPSTFSFDLRNK